MLPELTIRRLLCGIVIATILMLFGPSGNTEAKQPASVRFDASSEIACRVVPAPKAPTVDSGTKLIEARFRVSLLVSEGSPEDVEDVVVLVESPQHRLRVVDFLPKTEMANTVEGDVQTTHTIEKTATAGAQLGGTSIPIYGLASAQLGGTHHQVVAQTFKELPSKCLVLASGTTDGEHGVFFKIKGAPQVPLEGAKEFTCTFEVPTGWRGGWCLLSCHARGLNERCLAKRIEPCGFAETFVGLYLAGDEKAQEVAGRLDRLRLSQPIGSADRQALGLPLDVDQVAAVSNHHQPFEFCASLTGWTRLPVLSEHSSARDSAEANQIRAALQQTLSELSDLAGN
jgi:hypothetical protein